MMGGGMGSSGAWPLIDNLLDDSVYCNAYADIMTDLLNGGPLTAANFDEKAADYGARVGSYAAGEPSYDMAARIETVRASLALRASMCGGQRKAGADAGSAQVRKPASGDRPSAEVRPQLRRGSVVRYADSQSR